MGYQTLDAALSFPNERNIIPSKKSLLITDTLTSRGDFLIHHFIANQIKANKHVVLVGFAEIFNHYQNIARKLVKYFIGNLLGGGFAEDLELLISAC